MSTPWSDPAALDALLGGQRAGWRATLLRGLLCTAEVPYGWVVRRRNRRYDQNRTAVEHVGVPVVSVGNITTGGTGKTPVVAWLARWFQDRDLRVVLISRGYKTGGQGENDEARELRCLLPELPHLQNPDRVAAARQARTQYDPQVILLDDAFQHRRIHRDLDLVLIDALRPFGYGHLLPRGLLREPLEHLARAQVLGLSRADAVSPERRVELRAQLARYAPQANWLELVHRPTRLINVRGEVQPLDCLAGSRVAAFCGIGNPAGFRATIAKLGCELARWRTLPDHHAYGKADRAALARWCAADPPVDAVLCTGKDLTKFDTPALGSIPLWSVAIEICIARGLATLESQLQQILAG